MGCQQSSQAYINIKIILNEEFYKAKVTTRSVQSKSTISFLLKEINSELLRDHINLNKLKIRVSYMKKLYPSTSQETLEDLNIKDKDELQILCKEMQCEKIQLGIQSPNSSRLSLLSLYKDQTISKLKEKIRHKGVFSGNFQLIWKDIQLDEMLTIESYNITSGDTLNIMIFDRDLTSPTKKKSTPRWKVKKTGLVLEGFCHNDRCMAFKQRVSIVLGYGEFNMVQEMTQLQKHVCPVCQVAMSRLHHFGFVNCTYKANGVLMDNTLKDMESSVHCYEEFMQGQKLNWKELRIQVKPKHNSKTISHSPSSRRKSTMCSVDSTENTQRSEGAWDCYNDDISFERSRTHMTEP
jgi:hypothetical protein